MVARQACGSEGTKADAHEAKHNPKKHCATVASFMIPSPHLTNFIHTKHTRADPRKSQTRRGGGGRGPASAVS